MFATADRTTIVSETHNTKNFPNILILSISLFCLFTLTARYIKFLTLSNHTLPTAENFSIVLHQSYTLTSQVFIKVDSEVPGEFWDMILCGPAKI